MQEKGEEKEIIVAIIDISVCAHVLYKLTVRERKRICVKRRNEAPSHITLPRGALLSGIQATLRRIEGRCATLQPPLWSMCFDQSIVFLSTKLLAAQ